MQLVLREFWNRWKCVVSIYCNVFLFISGGQSTKNLNRQTIDFMCHSSKFEHISSIHSQKTASMTGFRAWEVRISKLRNRCASKAENKSARMDVVRFVWKLLRKLLRTSQFNFLQTQILAASTPKSNWIVHQSIWFHSVNRNTFYATYKRIQNAHWQNNGIQVKPLIENIQERYKSGKTRCDRLMWNSVPLQMAKFVTDARCVCYTIANWTN